MNTYSLTGSISRELQEIIHDIAVIDIVHIAHKRMRKVMGHGLEDLVFHIGPKVHIQAPQDKAPKFKIRLGSMNPLFASLLCE